MPGTPLPRTDRPSVRDAASRRRTSACLAALLMLSGCGDTRPTRLNVVLYVVDTLRADALAAYGNDLARTPHFDALAREGVLFENAYASSSWTRASMASILTGMHPWRHSVEGRKDRLPAQAITLADVLAVEGYSTALISANPNVSGVFGFGEKFDETRELFARSQPGHVRGFELVTPSDVVTAQALDWLDTAPRPFLLVALPIDPHRPYRPRPEFDPGMDPAQARGDPPSEDGLPRSRVRGLYQGEVAFNDDSFGALVAALRQRGLWDETIVVVTSDHGEEFWEYGQAGHGKNLTEPVLRIPLIIRHPDHPRLPAGARTRLRISHVDLVPTLLGLLGIAIPDGVDGVPFFSSPPDEDRPVYAALTLDGFDLRAAIGPRYKLLLDVDRDRRRLFDLDRPRGEAQPVTDDGAPAAAAREALGDGLARSLERRDGALEKTIAGRPPPEHEDALRALGYIE